MAAAATAGPASGRPAFGSGSSVRRPTTLLLDFDGVVLKTCAAHGIVTDRARGFTRNKLAEHARRTAAGKPGRSHSQRDAYCDELCDGLYTTYGHTALGLRALGVPATKAEFDAHVYRYVDATYFNDVRREDRHRLQARTLLRLVDACARSGVALHLFSNAPDGWCRAALQAMDARGDLEAALMQPSMAGVTGDLVKPQPEAYAAVEAAVLASAGSHQSQQPHEIWFVEDQLRNLHPVLHNPRWRKVLVTAQQAGLSANVHRDAGLYTIPDLHGLLHL